MLAIDALDHARATELINRLRDVNRVIAPVETRVPLAEMQVRACSLTAERLERLRHADAIVRRLSHDSGYDHEVWQFPVILIPLGTGGRARFGRAAPGGFGGRHDGAIGVDGRRICWSEICAELLHVEGIAGVFYDLTHKPPGTIEWE